MWCITTTHPPLPPSQSREFLWGVLSDAMLVCSRWHCVRCLLRGWARQLWGPQRACFCTVDGSEHFPLSGCLPAHCDAGVSMCNCVMMISHEHAPRAYLVALSGPSPLPCSTLASCTVHANFVWRPPPLPAFPEEEGRRHIVVVAGVVYVSLSLSSLHAVQCVHAALMTQVFERPVLFGVGRSSVK